jgi:hypothetical protein
MADAHSPKNQFTGRRRPAGLAAAFPSRAAARTRTRARRSSTSRANACRQRGGPDAVGRFPRGLVRPQGDGQRPGDRDGPEAPRNRADVGGKPQGVLAFNCAGRRGKLQRPEDELAAIQKAWEKTCRCSVATVPGKSGRWTPAEKTGEGAQRRQRLARDVYRAGPIASGMRVHQNSFSAPNQHFRHPPGIFNAARAASISARNRRASTG